jgi:cell division protein FtsB
VTRRRLVLLVIAALSVFAVQGGEYSTWDFLVLRREARGEAALITSLRAEVDSLKKEAIAVETDPEVQERLARELFGMLRAGEFSYNIIHPDRP